MRMDAWWLNFKDMKESERNRRKAKGDFNVDNQLMVCPKCQHVWGYKVAIPTKKRKDITETHPDFPTIGKKRKTCMDCK